MPKVKPEFKANGYIKSAHLDREGAKTVTFEFSLKNSKAAIALASLELMSRDLVNHQPVLLEVTVKQSLTKDYKNAGRNKKTQIIR